MAENRAVSSHLVINQRALRNVRSRWHRSGNDGHRHGVARPDNPRPVEEFWDAGAIYPAPGGGAGRSGQVLPGERGLTSVVSVPTGETRDSAGEDLQELSATPERAGYRLPEQPTSLGSTETPIKRDC